MQTTESLISQEVPLPVQSADNHAQEPVTTSETRPVQDSQQTEEHKSLEAKTQEKTNTEFAELKQVGGKDLYKSLVDDDKLCSPQSWKRILREVKEVNEDFQTLRTYMGVVQDCIGALHFLLYPSDGAMADKPLCGRILIPKEYPTVPPVVHLLNTTNRYNVDVYRGYAEPDRLQYMHSSMCFNILRSKSNGGTWEPEYTLSALISSLLQAIVSIKVAQEGGGEVTEFVSMEKLSSIHQSVELTYAKFKDVMPSRREIVHIEGMQVPTKHFNLPATMTSHKHNQDQIISSDPIFLQVPNDKIKDNVFSIGFDLSDLKTNRSTIFSIILSNTPLDPVGKKNDTILVRNGVTATAAKKKFGKQIDWYYHGKPMNESDLKLIVTVGYNQFCISYADGDRQAIHGDRPVSFLTPAEIGSVDKQKFYLNVFLKNKGGPTVTVKTFIPKYGYVHPVAGAL